MPRILIGRLTSALATWDIEPEEVNGFELVSLPPSNPPRTDHDNPGCLTPAHLEHVLKPRSLKGDDSGSELEHREVVLGDTLPANEQPAKAVVPTVGAFDDPAPRLASDAADHGLLASAANVRDDPARTDGRFSVGVVVALVETQVLRSARPARRPQYDGVERSCHHPFVVHVRACDQHGQGDTVAVREDVAFHTEFSPVRRVRPRFAPPFGAFTKALSSEAKSHLIPRRLS